MVVQHPLKYSVHCDSMHDIGLGLSLVMVTSTAGLKGHWTFSETWGLLVAAGPDEWMEPLCPEAEWHRITFAEMRAVEGKCTSLCLTAASLSSWKIRLATVCDTECWSRGTAGVTHQGSSYGRVLRNFARDRQTLCLPSLAILWIPWKERRI